MTPASGFAGIFDPGAPASPASAASSATEQDLGRLWCRAWAGGGTPAHWHGEGSIAVACHGEIRNPRQLRDQLDVPVGAGPAKLLRVAWQRWGEQALARADGVLAVALRDGDDFCLYRDPSGLRNLYYQVLGKRRIAFGTHLPTLLGLAGTSGQVSRRSLHEYLHFLDITPPHTLFEGVFAVEPGQIVSWSAQGVETRSIPEYTSPVAAVTNFANAVDTLDAQLRRSVQSCLAGARRPAAFLSGGVDSALICALAARERPETPAVTVGFDGNEYDETPVAQRIAAHLGLHHEVLRFGRRELVDAFARLSGEFDQPTADPAHAATVLAFEHCRDRFDAVLDGTCADEMVGTTPPRHVRLAVGWASVLPRAVRLGLARAMRHVPGLSGYTPILDFDHPADTMRRWRGFSLQEIEGLCGEPVSFAHTAFYRTFDRFPRHAHFERYSALVNQMPIDRLSQTQAMTDAPIRYPFTSLETDRFLRQLPLEFRWTPAQPKRILRELLARYVPRELWDLPKHSFNFPLADFLTADDCFLVRRYLDATHWESFGLVSTDVVRRYAQRFIAGEHELLFRVWALVVLGAWLEHHHRMTAH